MMSVAVAIHKWWQYKLEWQYTNATNIAPIVAIHVLVAIHQDDHSLCISLSHVSIAKYCDDTTTTINATTTNIPRRSLTASHSTRYYPRPQCHCLPLTRILFLYSLTMGNLFVISSFISPHNMISMTSLLEKKGEMV